IPSPSLVVQKEEQKKDTVTLAASKSPHAPDPIPDSADMLKESAVVSGNAPFVSTPLLLALGVSLLGAIGFFILKQGLL
ncbi:MAG: hypothetical protein U1A25_00935, partial [Candidatus Sungbacteria bacterium]|nr:hypothetical protein [Candidatus Sungbacteria bacterium]